MYFFNCTQVWRAKASNLIKKNCISRVIQRVRCTTRSCRWRRENLLEWCVRCPARTSSTPAPCSICRSTRARSRCRATGTPCSAYPRAGRPATWRDRNVSTVIPVQWAVYSWPVHLNSCIWRPLMFTLCQLIVRPVIERYSQTGQV